MDVCEEVREDAFSPHDDVISRRCVVAEKLLRVHRSRWVLRCKALKTRGRVRHIVQSRLWSRRGVTCSQWRFLEGRMA